MFSGLHRKVGIVFILSKAIISDFWTQSALTHTALCCTALHCITVMHGKCAKLPGNEQVVEVPGCDPFIRMHFKP